ncbi:MAG: aminomethyl-transferring glycine dehydrogenase subunit GcvPA, partial [Planctomycetes bacterium]|nr:aminomethyl-transferring glycine dehydrogenase subunit GcvPA [Planctomycetota bacterium]
QLTGMAVANASMYEAASALAEAILMLTGPPRQRVIVCQPIHPHYLATVRTYLVDSPIELVVVPQAGGSADAQGLMVQLTADTAVVVVQSPNFYGVIERGLACLSAAVHESGAALVQVFDPISLALLKGPGQLGADVAVGEGQALGIPLSFGGPYLGLLAVAEKHLRRMPGRLVGQTVDAEGRTAYCLTLQTREQHIRRDKATSNICTNEGLCALRAAVYLAAMGPHGLKRAATLSMQRAHELAGRIGRLGGYEVLFADKPFFREFVVRCKRAKPEAIIDAGLDAGVLAGVPMGPFDEEMADCMLIACTEKRSLEQIDTLVGVFKKMSKAGPAK